MTARMLRRERVAERHSTPFPRTVSLKEWCEIRGVSLSTARRQIALGNLRVIHLSARRLGITEDDDQAFLASGGN
jgi:hypothetical protein